MSVVNLQNEVVHFEVMGRSRPILFLHGWVGSWRYWVPSMQAASTGYRAYALDLWGFGHTAWNARQYSLNGQAALLGSFLDAMGIGRIALVGHGLGAGVALAYASKYPELVDRLMLTSLPLDGNSIPTRLRAAPVAELVDWLLDKQAALEPARLEALRADPSAIRTSLEDLSLVNPLALIQKLTTPCLLVHGQLDPVTPAPGVEEWGQLPERAHAVVLEQSGHFPMLDETNKFNRLLGDFLSLASGESPRQLQLKEEWKRRVR